MGNSRPAADWLRRGHQAEGVDLVEAFFQGAAYGPHRHDSYAIGLTMAGVQSFRYRSSMRHSLSGQALVLHPDEVHDGQAGTDAGFHYRIAYLAPSLLQQVLGGAPLPFVDGGVSADGRLVRAARGLLSNFDAPAGSLERDDALVDIATALRQVAGQPDLPGGDFLAAQRAREYIHDALLSPLTLEQLAQAGGRDRWSLSRDFRSYFGTSPHRYVTLRRLELARQLMLNGMPLADSAVHAGFADQPHLTRHFVAAYGISPGRWLRLNRRQ
ncbi:AraC family transcriptional regulator [Duganella sp. HH101]|uniref:helix-turn-helix transcriptional regulator n=1 Tax=Duganella sp. HH101 TaxID=1781066 RepID=UPI0008746F2D|nr:AraC family transcriptional regulator [Duganella sp. HH101]OFA04324.1 multiple antibiotic resistance protein MarA [Duganella sp. HH101]